MAVLPLVLYFSIVLILFLVIRAFWCWYFKVNEVLEKLDEISRKLDGK
ncbi:MAG: hypothetical protein J6S43_02380 [Lentisphaeria bacterium]|nr:hypothetical protein [Lentisphaeria bacterium]